jgi:hypothetical protein
LEVCKINKLSLNANNNKRDILIENINNNTKIVLKTNNNPNEVLHQDKYNNINKSNKFTDLSKEEIIKKGNNIIKHLHES